MVFTFHQYLNGSFYLNLTSEVIMKNYKASIIAGSKDWELQEVLIVSELLYIYIMQGINFDPMTSNLSANPCVSKSLSCVSSQTHGLYSPWTSPGQNTGVGSLSLLQGIFPTQGSSPSLIAGRFSTSWATREDLLQTTRCYFKFETFPLKVTQRFKFGLKLTHIPRESTILAII